MTINKQKLLLYTPLSLYQFHLYSHLANQHSCNNLLVHTVLKILKIILKIILSKKLLSLNLKGQQIVLELFFWRIPNLKFPMANFYKQTHFGENLEALWKKMSLGGLFWAILGSSTFRRSSKKCLFGENIRLLSRKNGPRIPQIPT